MPTHLVVTVLSLETSGLGRLLYNFIPISKPPPSGHHISCSILSSSHNIFAHYFCFHLIATAGIQQSTHPSIRQVL